MLTERKIVVTIAKDLGKKLVVSRRRKGRRQHREKTPQEIHHLQLWLGELIYATKTLITQADKITYELLTSKREDEGICEDEGNWLSSIAAKSSVGYKIKDQVYVTSNK